VKEILGILPHMPAFDSCFPLLDRLARRGNLRVSVITGPRIRATEPRVVAVADASPVAVQHRSLLGTELWSLADMARADAVLTHADPRAYFKAGRPRDIFARLSGKRTVFVQHGLVQYRLNYAQDGDAPTRYQARLMLVWRDLTADERAVIAGTPDIRTVGLVKRNLLPPRPVPPELAQRIAAARKVVLVCHNYGHDHLLYDDAQRDRAFGLLRATMQARPDVLFIIRAHRGRKLPAHQGAVSALVAGLPNVVLSDRHEGYLKFAGIDDVLAISDRVLTHPSTVVLDALSQGKPVAVLDNHRPDLAFLPEIASHGDMAAWLDGGADAPALAEFTRRYGHVDANLDRAAEAVETHLYGPGQVS